VRWLIAPLLCLSLLCGLLLGAGPVHAREPEEAALRSGIKYVAVGDSYTIGEGVAVQDRWPDQLVRQLHERGVDLERVANPSRTGYTTADVLAHEIPVLEEIKPAFVTLLIGVNDYVRGVPPEVFEKKLATVLDRITLAAPDAALLMITIPDYGKTPGGASFGDPAETAAGIAVFNSIIISMARQRNIVVADIYTVSQHASAAGKVAGDGLHPSAAQYRDWLTVILPAAERALKQ